MKKTIFLDIDGCIFKHHGNLIRQVTIDPILLDGVLEKINEWNEKDYMIILTTGRKKCSRKITEEQLSKYGIFYDKLIMGLPRGERVVINDRKTIKKANGYNSASDFNVASAIQINRNEGLSNVNL